MEYSNELVATKTLVATNISELLGDVSISDAKKWMINRCHRGGDPKFYDTEKGKHRPIYVNMFAWDDCERLIKKSRSKDAPKKIKIDYKYGPITTKRRKLAMDRRYELKLAGELDQGYIKFPAIVMGKKAGEKKYRKMDNFSTAEVDMSDLRY